MYWYKFAKIKKEALNKSDLYDFYLIARISQERFEYLFKTDPEKKFYFAKKLDEIKKEYIKGGMFAINLELSHSKNEELLQISSSKEFPHAAKYFRDRYFWPGSSFAGESWAVIAEKIYDLSQIPDLMEYVLQNPSDNALINQIYQLIFKIDHINDICHNTGIALPKMMNEYYGNTIQIDQETKMPTTFFKNEDEKTKYMQTQILPNDYLNLKEELKYKLENFLDYKRDESINNILPFRGNLDSDLLRSIREVGNPQITTHIYNLDYIIKLYKEGYRNKNVNVDSITQIIVQHLSKINIYDKGFSHLIELFQNMPEDLKEYVLIKLLQIKTNGDSNEYECVLRDLLRKLSYLPKTKSTLLNDSVFKSIYYFYKNNQEDSIIFNRLREIIGIIKNSEINPNNDVINEIKKDIFKSVKNTDIIRPRVLSYDLAYFVDCDELTKLNEIFGEDFIKNIIYILVEKSITYDGVKELLQGHSSNSVALEKLFKNVFKYFEKNKSSKLTDIFVKYLYQILSSNNQYNANSKIMMERITNLIKIFPEIAKKPMFEEIVILYIDILINDYLKKYTNLRSEESSNLSKEQIVNSVGDEIFVHYHYYVELILEFYKNHYMAVQKVKERAMKHIQN